MGARFYARGPRKPDRTRYRHQLLSPASLPVVAASTQDAVSTPDHTLTASSRRIALLCPGPSLRTTWIDALFEKFNLVIAINDAAWLYRHHWIVGSDRHILQPVLDGQKPRPLIGALTNRAYGPRFQAIGLQYVRPETFNPNGPLGKRHTSYSMVAAVWFALRQCGPQGVVEIHGFDASPDPSITGIDRHGSHKGARWRDEAQRLRMVWDASRIRSMGNAASWLLDFVAGKRDTFGP